MLSTAPHAGFLRNSFEANKRGGPPSCLLAINVVGGEPLSYFRGGGPSLNGGLPAGLQKPAKGIGDKVLALWFAQQPFKGNTGINFDLSQLRKTSLAIFNRQKWRGVSYEPALAGLSRISKGPNDSNLGRFQLLGFLCHMSRQYVCKRVDRYWF